MNEMKFTSAGALIDEAWGTIGTPQRDAMEAQIQEELNVCRLGATIKNERLRQSMTQEELGAKVGVKRSQICKIESGKCSMNLSTISRVFRALGIATATLDLGIAGKVALW